MVGRYPKNHDAAIFSVSVDAFGMDEAIRQHMVECTEDFEEILNAPNRKVSVEEAERKARAYTREAHLAEYKELGERAKAEGWDEAKLLVERIQSNLRWKQVAEERKEELLRGPVQNFIRNCGDTASQTATRAA